LHLFHTRERTKEPYLDHQHCSGTCQKNDVAASQEVSWQVHSFERDTAMKTNKQVYPTDYKLG
jgi:hypothetical protein